LAFFKDESVSTMPQSFSSTQLSAFPDQRVDALIAETIRRRRIDHPEAWDGENSWVSRFTVGCHCVAPVIAHLAGERKLRVLELGCGHGQKALSYAPHVGSVLGIDLLKDHVDFANYSALKMGSANTEFRHVAAEDLDAVLADDQFDLIMLYAVMEHLTPSERLSVLEKSWAHLKDDGMLYIGETPNRIAVYDMHSTYLLFPDVLPDELYIPYVERFSTREDTLRNNKMFGDPVTGSYRVGRGVSFHEFHMVFGSIDKFAPHVIHDSFRSYGRALYPLRRNEVSLLDTFRFHWTNIPQMFSRYWIEGVFAKTASPNRALEFKFEKCVIEGSLIAGVDPMGLEGHVLGKGGIISARVDAPLFQFTICTQTSNGVLAVEVDGQTIEEIDTKGILINGSPNAWYVTFERALRPGPHYVALRVSGGEYVTVGDISSIGSRVMNFRDPRAPRVITPDLLAQYKISG